MKHGGGSVVIWDLDVSVTVGAIITTEGEDLTSILSLKDLECPSQSLALNVMWALNQAVYAGKTELKQFCPAEWVRHLLQWRKTLTASFQQVLKWRLQLLVPTGSGLVALFPLKKLNHWTKRDLIYLMREKTITEDFFLFNQNVWICLERKLQYRQ